MELPRISVIGLGKLGSPMAAAIASRGFTVTCTDANAVFVHAISQGIAPVLEPGLQELISKNTSRLHAVTTTETAVLESDITFIIVPTPSTVRGDFSSEFATAVCTDIGEALRKKTSFHTVVLCSTVMPGTMGNVIIPTLERVSQKRVGTDFGVCYNPEFIALGSVIHNLLNPDFVLVGESDPRSGETIAAFYHAFLQKQAPIKRLQLINAEIAKISLNSFVTNKITFANLLTQLCDKLPGGNIDEVCNAIGEDARIGKKYLNGGLSYGGPCFPRDNRALALAFSEAGLSNNLSTATDEANNRHTDFIVKRISDALPKSGSVAVLGLSYKPNTPVIEESPSIPIIQHLVERGYRVSVYDPAAMSNAKKVLPDSVRFTESAKQCVQNVDVVILATTWKELCELEPSDFIREGKKTIYIDCWRSIDPKKYTNAVDYIALGVNPKKQAPMDTQKTALVCGGGGFIGSHLIRRLVKDGYWVRGADLKKPDFSPTVANDFVVGDLRDPRVVAAIFDRPFDEVYQLAADMGGAGYIFSGEHDAYVMHNSAQINLNVAEAMRTSGSKKIFYSSSACIYPEHNQRDTDHPNCAESSAYPANPDSEYGWEKLFSERLYLAYHRNFGLDVRIARFHNIFGPEGTWRGGREKAPAAICRKIAEATNGGSIEMWGDGKQTRSFLYIDECLEGVRRLMDSETFQGPVNIGSDEMVSLNQLAKMAMEIGKKHVSITHIPGPLGVRGRNSDNTLITEKLNWHPKKPLRQGLEQT